MLSSPQIIEKKQLRKALRLKGCIFLLAWVTFFIHNVIPHNHIYDNFQNCNKLVHSSFLSITNGDGSLKVDKEHSDQPVCHLSNFLFLTINPEIILAASNRSIHLSPDFSCKKIFIDYNHPCPSDVSEGTASLRAPPVL